MRLPRFLAEMDAHAAEARERERDGAASGSLLAASAVARCCFLLPLNQTGACASSDVGGMGGCLGEEPRVGVEDSVVDLGHQALRSCIQVLDPVCSFCGAERTWVAGVE